MKSYFFAIFGLLFWLCTNHAMSQIAPNYKEVITKADSLITKYKFESALTVLTKSDTLNKDILLRIAHCNLRMGVLTDAVIHYEQVLRIDSTDITSLNQLGLLYARDGATEKALTCFTRLVKLDSTNSYFYKQAGLMSARLNNTILAVRWFKRTLNYNPIDGEASLALGNLFMEIELYKSVDSVVLEALSSDPHSKSLLLLLAKSAYKQQNYESAIITFNILLQSTDTTVLTARLLGESYLKLKDFNKVITCMKFLIQNRYDDEHVYYSMAIALREIGQNSASIPWFELAVKKAISKNIDVYYAQLGQSCEETRNYLCAIKAYRNAYSYSHDGILLYHLARIYDEYYEDKKPAIDHFRKYLKSEDSTRLVREYAEQRVKDIQFLYMDESNRE